MRIMLPTSLAELYAAQQEFPAGAIMAGGTDLLVKLRHSGRRPPALICLERIAELQELTLTDAEITIGAAVTLQRLLECDTVKTEFAALHQALTVLASPPIRHSATLAGNLCTASPAGDTLPPLYVFNASVDTVCTGKYRRIPVAEFIAGPGRTVLQPGEVVTSVRLARGPSGRNSGYYKVGKRQAMAIAVASLAALVTPEKNGRRQIRLAWGSVGPTVMTAPAIESFLADRSFTEENLRQAGALVSEFVQPIDDLRASAGYRRQLAANLLLRLAADFDAGE